MPAMTAREFVDTIAMPTVEDFKANPSQRRGYLACLSVAHIADYLKPAGERESKAVFTRMEQELGAPFVALWCMSNAVKHRESVGKGGAILMQSGSDTARSPTGFGNGEMGGSMNPGTGQPGNPLRFDDRGGRYVEHEGRYFDMLDLCMIALQGYARVFQVDLAGSAIDCIHYSAANYPK